MKNKWLTGNCSIFAISLQKRFGGELWAVINHSNKYPEDDFLIHCCVVIDGIAYDANGVNYNPIKGYEVDEMDKYNDIVFQWRKVDEKWLFDIHDGCCLDLIDESFAYIDNNMSLFSNIDKIMLPQ
jgi:hypothetical protein